MNPLRKVAAVNISRNYIFPIHTDSRIKKNSKWSDIRAKIEFESSFLEIILFDFWLCLADANAMNFWCITKKYELLNCLS